jgi:ABC-type transport system involved in cytochrome c biogenesis permease subunit
MHLIDQLLSFILPFLYLMILYAFSKIFFGQERKHEIKTRILLSMLLLGHGLELLIRQIYLKTMSLSSVFDTLSFLAFSVLLVYYLIERISDNQASGFFILIFTFFPVLIASFNPTWQWKDHFMNSIEVKIR